jgi:hypothetical protein
MPGTRARRSPSRSSPTPGRTRSRCAASSTGRPRGGGEADMRPRNVVAAGTGTIPEDPVGRCAAPTRSHWSPTLPISAAPISRQRDFGHARGNGVVGNRRYGSWHDTSHRGHRAGQEFGENIAVDGVSFTVSARCWAWAPTARKPRCE